MTEAFPKKKTFLFIAIPFIFFVFLLEIGIRIFGDTLPNRVLCYDPILGRSYCPNTKGYIKDNQVKMYIEVNSDGLLGKPYTINRVPGNLRIAVLGDSFTSGEAVSPDKKFTGVWETKLSEKLPPRVEVINFGVGGTGTWQQLQRFHTKAQRYKPDLTVLAFCWCNDIENNIDQFISKKNSRNPLLDQYDIDLWDWLRVKQKNFNKWLWNNSRLYQFTRTRYNHLEHSIKRMFLPDYMKAPVSTGKMNPLHQEKSFGVHHARLVSTKSNMITSSPNFKDTVSISDDLYFFDSEGWEITRKLIIKLHNEVKKNGSKLVVIHFGGNQQQQQKFTLLPVKQFDRFLSDQGIDFFNAYKLFSRMEEADLKKYFIPNDGHFSETGHAKFAELTVNFLIKLLQNKK
jgi:lysophospholipase L1-like esterase